MVSTLARNASDMVSIPALGAIFPIFITSTTLTLDMLKLGSASILGPICFELSLSFNIGSGTSSGGRASIRVGFDHPIDPEQRMHL